MFLRFLGCLYYNDTFVLRDRFFIPRREKLFCVVVALLRLSRSSVFRRDTAVVIMVRDNRSTCLADFLGRDQYTGNNLVNDSHARVKRVNSRRARV